MKKQGGFSLIEGLLLILLITIVGFGSWYVWSQNKESSDTKSTAPASTQSTTEIPENMTKTTEPVENLIANWKTYTNDTLGFAFKYPEEAVIAERQDTSYFEVTASNIKDIDTPPNRYVSGNYKIQVHVNTSGNSLEKIINNEPLGKLLGAIEVVDGVEKAVTQVTSEEIQGPGYDIHWFAKAGKVISISIFGDAPFETTTLLDTVTIK